MDYSPSEQRSHLTTQRTFPKLTSMTFFFTGNSDLSPTWQRKMKSLVLVPLSRSENLQEATVGISNAKVEDSSFEQLASFFTALSEPGEKGLIICPMLSKLMLKKARFTSAALDYFQASRVRPGNLVGGCKVTLDECEIIDLRE